MPNQNRVMEWLNVYMAISGKSITPPNALILFYKPTYTGRNDGYSTIEYQFSECFSQHFQE